jgi:uncharacterized membrane protein
MAPRQRTAFAIALFMDIGQGAGTSGASGVRPFLPALLTGALARGDDGIDFSGTSYSFLESEWFLLVLLLLAVAAYALNRRSQVAGRRSQEQLVERAVAVIGVVLGALLFAGSLADDGQTSWWGLIAGAACAALGYLALATLFARARSRIASQDGAGGAESLIDVYAEGIALALAALAIFVEPVGYLALAVFVFLIVRSRGEGAQKYGGLRILR